VAYVIALKLLVSGDEQINILREHILNSKFEQLGASPFDINIVAYVSENVDIESL
jgi:hypothetical protein